MAKMAATNDLNARDFHLSDSCECHLRERWSCLTLLKSCRRDMLMSDARLGPQWRTGRMAAAGSGMADFFK